MMYEIKQYQYLCSLRRLLGWDLCQGSHEAYQLHHENHQALKCTICNGGLQQRRRGHQPISWKQISTCQCWILKPTSTRSTGHRNLQQYDQNWQPCWCQEFLEHLYTLVSSFLTVTLSLFVPLLIHLHCGLSNREYPRGSVSCCACQHWLL